MTDLSLISLAGNITQLIKISKFEHFFESPSNI